MSEIENTGPLTPSQTEKLYRQEYNRGANLFEKALNQAHDTSYDPKKEQFQDVMNKAMEILNQSARGLKDENLLKQNQKIEQNYRAYQKNPDKEHLDALQKDLSEAQEKS